MGGNAAYIIINSLLKEGINVDGIFIDEEYYTSEKIMGLPVYKVSDEKLLEDECHVIVGYDISLEDAEKKLQNVYGKRFNDKCKLIFIDAVLRDDDPLTYEYFLEHKREFEEIYNLCDDDESRKVLTAFINAKITTNCKYLKGVISDELYFKSDLVRLSNNTVFVDCGAYDGKKTLQFIDKVNGKYKKIIAFEPNAQNMQLFLETIKKHQIQKIDCHQTGVWNSSGYLSITNTGNGLYSKLTYGNPENMIAVESIDDVLKDSDFKNSQIFIKMEINGSELKALEGAKETISKHHPILAIVAYHNKEDILEIPKLILSIDSSYKIYFRHHRQFTLKLVCYAI